MAVSDKLFFFTGDPIVAMLHLVKSALLRKYIHTLLLITVTIGKAHGITKAVFICEN